MKKYLNLESLTCAEVPHELDLRILAAGRLRQTALRRRRRLRLIASGTAAAAALLVAAGICVAPGTGGPRTAQEDRASLMALSDWTSVEQAGYNLASEIDSSSSSWDLLDNRINIGV